MGREAKIRKSSRARMFGARVHANTFSFSYYVVIDVAGNAAGTMKISMMGAGLVAIFLSIGLLL